MLPKGEQFLLHMWHGLVNCTETMVFCPESVLFKLLLTRKLLNQGFLLVKLKSSLRKFYGHHNDLVDRYGISVSQMTTDMFHLSQH